MLWSKGNNIRWQRINGVVSKLLTIEYPFSKNLIPVCTEYIVSISIKLFFNFFVSPLKKIQLVPYIANASGGLFRHKPVCRRIRVSLTRHWLPNAFIKFGKLSHDCFFIRF